MTDTLPIDDEIYHIPPPPQRGRRSFCYFIGNSNDQSLKFNEGTANAGKNIEQVSESKDFSSR